ncbi:MAG: glycosyltransferase, partial [Bacteroidales bacterium]|nr:glycosyltransferase [Bacteroidales bacterium]
IPGNDNIPILHWIFLTKEAVSWSGVIFKDLLTNKKDMKIICIGNFPPRKCGIATFTENLVKSIMTAARDHNMVMEVEVIAMNDLNQVYDYPEIVKLSINDKDKGEYLKAADYINRAQADLCLFQHEYGIYGGNSGLHILSLLRRIKIPIVSTFHTVLQKPTFHQLEVLKKIAGYSEKVVIMNPMAIPFLTDVFGIAKAKIAYIEHGVPDFGSVDKKKLQKPATWQHRKVLLTFGLLGRSKGIETVIKALPEVVAKHPDLLYCVLGKTHPHVVKYAGEEYRESLEELTVKLGLDNNVEFLNKYVSEEELTNHLLAADIYVTPYLNKAQITSGTLCYAVGGGSAVISTPYWHAETLLADGRGRLFDFEDHDALKEILIELLENPAELEKLKQRAFAYGLRITWPRIGFEYISTFQLAIEGFKKFDTFWRPFRIEIPELDLFHLERMTDDTGLVQHANGCVADYKTGYCLDDNARALMVCLITYKRTGDRKYLALIHRYLAYIMYLQNSDGSFKNYLTYWRNMVEEVGSDDAYGRAVWALGALIRLSPCDSMFHVAMELFYKATTQFSRLSYARGYANCIFGLYHYIRRFPDQEKYIKMLTGMADKLVQKFRTHQQEGWNWFESAITYDNGILPASLYTAYIFSDNPEYLDVADASREFLEDQCFYDGQLTLIGNREWWMEKHSKSEFAQQPIDAMAMIIMYDCAYRATKNRAFTEKLKICFDWFFGKNDLNLPLYDAQTHGCNDGLEELEVNRNQGAESIISYLMSWLIAKPYVYGVK